MSADNEVPPEPCAGERLRMDLRGVLARHGVGETLGCEDATVADYLMDCLGAHIRLASTSCDLRVSLSDFHEDDEADEGPPESWYERDYKKWAVVDLDDERLSSCRDCGAAIRWQRCRTRKGVKNMPLDVASEEQQGDRRYAELHFAVCPESEQNRRKRERENGTPTHQYTSLDGGDDDTPF